MDIAFVESVTQLMLLTRKIDKRNWDESPTKRIKLIWFREKKSEKF